MVSLFGNTVARCSSESQRSFAGVPSSPSSFRSTWPANRLPNCVIMLGLLVEGRGDASRCYRGRCRGSDNRRVPYHTCADYLQKPRRHKDLFSARVDPTERAVSFRHLTSPATRSTLRITYRGLPEVPTPGIT